MFVFYCFFSFLSSSIRLRLFVFCCHFFFPSLWQWGEHRLFLEASFMSTKVTDKMPCEKCQMSVAQHLEFSHCVFCLFAFTLFKIWIYFSMLWFVMRKLNGLSLKHYILLTKTDVGSSMISYIKFPEKETYSYKGLNVHTRWVNFIHMLFKKHWN